MKKSYNQTKKYISLSRREVELLEAMENVVVFSVSDIRKTTALKHSSIMNALMSLKRKGVLVAVKKDNYTLAESINENIFPIALKVYNPAYISFWCAASYYGFTEQQVRTVQLVSTQQHEQAAIGSYNVEVVRYIKKRFFGYTKEGLAEKEKLIVDMLYKPELCGGYEEIEKIVKGMWKSIDQKMLLEYLKRFGNKSLFSRLGFILDMAGLKRSVNFKNHMPKGFVKLDPSKEKSCVYDRNWRLIVNDKQTGIG